MIQLLVTNSNHQMIKEAWIDVPTRKSSALKTGKEVRAAGTTCDNMSSSDHTKYKMPSATRRVCASLSYQMKRLRSPE